MSGSYSPDDSECDIRITVRDSKTGVGLVATCMVHGGFFDPRVAGLSGICPNVQDRRRFDESRTRELSTLDEEQTLILPPRPTYPVRRDFVSRLTSLLSVLWFRISQWLRETERL